MSNQLTIVSFEAWSAGLRMARAELLLDFHLLSELNLFFVSVHGKIKKKFIRRLFMDNQFYRTDRHSKRMEALSLLMGILSLTTMCLVYPTLICGSLSIVFALLSRGGEMRLSYGAKIGLILGSISLGIIIALMIYTLLVANIYYGGMENMLRELYQMVGIDYDALIKSYQ